MQTSVYLLELFDKYFSNDSKKTLGIYSSKEKALEAVGYNKESWKKDEFYENGRNQWISDKLEEGIMISQYKLNELNVY